MSKQEYQTGMSRRGFMRRSSCASMSAVGIANSLSLLTLMNAALVQGAPLTDYKALVCLFLFGGIDSNNVLIPAAGHPGRADYDSSRGVLGIPSGSLHSISPLNTADPFGLHPNLLPLANLFNSGELAFVSNVGTLAYPIATRDDYLNQTVPLPPQLFSHADQQSQWQSSVPDKPFQSGWGGRIADLINDSHNVPDGKVSMNISLAGINSFQVSPTGAVVQYAMTPGGVVPLDGYGTDYTSALDSNGNYKTTTAGKELKAFEDIMRYTHGHLLKDGYNTVIGRARSNEGLIGDALDAADTSGVDFDSIFPAFNAVTDDPNKVSQQLKMVAKLIAGREELGNERQIFFCSMGGFDTHRDQNGTLDALTDELGIALKAFSDAMIALSVNDKVLTCTNSDFARTFSPNGDIADTAGSDHGWGGHQIVMGGPVVGQNIFGQFPSLKVGQDLDTEANRGRWIPTTSVDQYGAVIAKWLGVDENAMDIIFPNLPRFDDPFTSGNLGFLNFGA